MYSYSFSKQAEKFLAKQEKSFIKNLLHKIEVLRKSPHENTLDIKALRGKNNSYRLRIGKNRILYQIQKQKLHIYFFDAWSRWDIYK